MLGAWGENSLFFSPIGKKAGAVRIDVQAKDFPPPAPFRLVIESDGPLHDPVALRLRAEPLTDATDHEQTRGTILQALRTLDADPRVPETARRVQRSNAEAQLAKLRAP